MLEMLFKEARELHLKQAYDQACRKFAAILRYQPDHVESHIYLAQSLRALNKLSSARLHYERALAFKPHNASVWSSYGNVLCDLKLFDEAEAAHARALKLGNNDPQFIYNASIVPFNNNQPALAIELSNQVLQHLPHHSAKWNRSLANLQLGNYQSGFEDYECRLTKNPVRHPDIPCWQGEPLAGKRILIVREQGLGDMIQFCRFAKHLSQRGAQVYIESKPELKRFLRCVKGVQGVLDEGKAGNGFDFYVPLMSLPHKLGIQMEDLSGTHDYLDVSKIETKSALSSRNVCLRVGMVWASKPGHAINRSCPLENFLPLFKHKQVEFYSFQFGESVQDIQKLGLDAMLNDLSPKLNGFYDTAAYMRQMDLVITIDSSSAHLAGALGIETWLLLHASDWRWLLQREDSPWYPGMKLYRQHTHNNWEQSVSRLIQDFDRRVNEKAALAG